MKHEGSYFREVLFEGVDHGVWAGVEGVGCADLVLRLVVRVHEPNDAARYIVEIENGRTERRKKKKKRSERERESERESERAS